MILPTRCNLDWARTSGNGESSWFDGSVQRQTYINTTTQTKQQQHQQRHDNNNDNNKIANQHALGAI
jgi:hypothetical protein